MGRTKVRYWYSKWRLPDRRLGTIAVGPKPLFPEPPQGPGSTSPGEKVRRARVELILARLLDCFKYPKKSHGKEFDQPSWNPALLSISDHNECQVTPSRCRRSWSCRASACSYASTARHQCRCDRGFGFRRLKATGRGIWPSSCNVRDPQTCPS